MRSWEVEITSPELANQTTEIDNGNTQGRDTESFIQVTIIYLI